jgi:hypothetical protein
VREDSGVLRDRRVDLGLLAPTRNDLHARLLESIAKAAVNRQPFTKTGQAGLFSRRHELPTAFHSVGKHALESLAQDLLNTRKIIQCRLKASEKSPGTWLDILGGPVAQESERLLKPDSTTPENYPKNDTESVPGTPHSQRSQRECPTFGNAVFEENQTLNHSRVPSKNGGPGTQKVLINQAFPPSQQTPSPTERGSVSLTGNASHLVEEWFTPPLGDGVSSANDDHTPGFAVMAAGAGAGEIDEGVLV